MKMNKHFAEETTAMLVFEPGSHREKDPNVQPLQAALRWKEIEICLDFDCACGRHDHIDTHGGQAPPYIQCLGCKRVYRCNPRIQLIRLTPPEVELHRRWQADHRSKPADARDPGEDRETDPNQDRLRADLQWKGTYACLDYACECGHSGVASGFFMDHVDCAKCGAVYRCNNRIQLVLLTKSEVAELRHLGVKPLTPDDA